MIYACPTFMDNATGSTEVFLGLSCDAGIYKRMQTVSNLHSSEIDRVQQQSVWPINKRHRHSEALNI